MHVELAMYTAQGAHVFAAEVDRRCCTVALRAFRALEPPVSDASALMVALVEVVLCDLSSAQYVHHEMRQ